ncbi:MAG: hypothetical protein RIR26_1370 [Pseudomonadota bacterium]|jgi:NitT/TauT family transport system ATP-binding protein
MIEIRDLAVTLGSSPILESVDLEIRPKTLTTVMGPSGCGKSTFLRALMGITPCTSGTLRVQGQEPQSLKTWSTGQQIFGLVPQSPLLLPWKTVLENILTARPPNKSAVEAEQRAIELLQRVGLTEARDLYPWQLSLGMAARVSLARSLLVENQILLLDEPFASIDATSRFQLQCWLLELVERMGQTALLVTHDPREALLLADEILVLNGKPATVTQRFALPEKQRRKGPDWIFSAESGSLEKSLRALL